MRAVNSNSALLQIKGQVGLSFSTKLQEQTIVFERAQQKGDGEVFSMGFRDVVAGVAGGVLMTEGPGGIF